MRLYKFQSHLGYNFYACHAKDGDQYLLGFVENDFVVLKFSPDGMFQGITKEGQIEQNEFNLAEEMANAWITQHELEIGTIEVEKFNIPSYDLRITDIPLDLEDYLENKADYSEEDQIENERQIELWRSNQKYALYWGAWDCWLNRYGEITAT